MKVAGDLDNKLKVARNVRLILIILSFFVILIFCSKKESTEPAPTSGSISGTVMNKAGNAAVPSAIITTEPPTSSVSSDANGKYTIEEVDSGNYIVQAVKDGYDPGNVNVNVEAGKTVTADIRMGILLANHPPTKPQLIAPENSSEDQTIYPNLQWKGSTDQDGDAIVYDLYFGKENPPPLNLENIDSTSVKKSNLDTATVYYWQVVAKDSKGAKTASDVWQFKTTPYPIPMDGLVAYYPFNGNAKDESGNGNDGIVHGQAISFTEGISNSAISFDNRNSGTFTVNDYVELPVISLNNFTIAHWVKYLVGASTYYTGSTYSFGAHPGDQLRSEITNDGHIRGYLRIDNIDNTTDYANISDHQWHHIVIVGGKDTLKLYVDGVMYSSVKTKSFRSFINKKQFVALHQWYNGNGQSSRFTGEIDELYIYNRTLTIKEIKSIYYNTRCNK